MFSNVLLKSRSRSNHITKAVSIAIVQSTALNNSQNSITAALSSNPTPGNFLIAIVNYQNSSSRSPLLDGGTAGWSLLTGNSARGTSSVEMFGRKVVTGDGHSTTATFSTSAPQSILVVEIQGVTGSASSINSINSGPYPQTISIAAGISGALPLAFNCWGSGGGTTYSPVAPSGWTFLNGVTTGVNPIGMFYDNTLSNGSTITIAPNGSISNSLYPQSCGFLLS